MQWTTLHFWLPLVYIRVQQVMDIDQKYLIVPVHSLGVLITGPGEEEQLGCNYVCKRALVIIRYFSSRKWLTLEFLYSTIVYQKKSFIFVKPCSILKKIPSLPSGPKMVLIFSKLRRFHKNEGCLGRNWTSSAALFGVESRTYRLLLLRNSLEIFPVWGWKRAPKHPNWHLTKCTRFSPEMSFLSWLVTTNRHWRHSPDLPIKELVCI